MTKRGRPFKSQPTQTAAAKQPRLDIDEAVDDVLPIAIAQKTLLTCAHNSRGGINQTHATRHWRERPPKFNFDKWVDDYGLE